MLPQTPRTPNIRWALECAGAIAPLKTTVHQARNLGKLLLFVKDWRGYMQGPVTLHCWNGTGWNHVTEGRSYDRFMRAFDLSAEG